MNQLSAEVTLTDALTVIMAMANRTGLEPCLDPACIGYLTVERGHCHERRYQPCRIDNVTAIPEVVHDNIPGSKWKVGTRGTTDGNVTISDAMTPTEARVLAHALTCAAAAADKLNHQPAPFSTGGTE